MTYEEAIRVLCLENLKATVAGRNAETPEEYQAVWNAFYLKTELERQVTEESTLDDASCREIIENVARDIELEYEIGLVDSE